MPVDIETRDAVLDAFRQARVANQAVADCYRAAVNAWMDLHPDHNRAQAAKSAVEIVQQSFGTLQDIARK